MVEVIDHIRVFEASHLHRNHILPTDEAGLLQVPQHFLSDFFLAEAFQETVWAEGDLDQEGGTSSFEAVCLPEEVEFGYPMEQEVLVRESQGKMVPDLVFL